MLNTDSDSSVGAASSATISGSVVDVSVTSEMEFVISCSASSVISFSIPSEIINSGTTDSVVFSSVSSSSGIRSSTSASTAVDAASTGDASTYFGISMTSTASRNAVSWAVTCCNWATTACTSPASLPNSSNTSAV